MAHLKYLLLIPIFRFLININHWYFIDRVLKKHDVWLNGLPTNATQEDKQLSTKAANWISSHAMEIVRVYELTGRGKPLRSFMEPVGYGHIQEQQMNILENLLFQNTDLLKQARDLLLIAKGYFLTNAIKSLNPLFWLEILFFLPRAIFSASGLESSSKLVDTGLKFVQILYWLLIILAFIFKPELFNFLFDHRIT